MNARVTEVITGLSSPFNFTGVRATFRASVMQSTDINVKIGNRKMKHTSCCKHESWGNQRPLTDEIAKVTGILGFDEQDEPGRNSASALTINDRHSCIRETDCENG